MLIRCARCVLCLVLASDNDSGRCGCARSTARLFEQFATHKAKLKKHLFALLLDYILGGGRFRVAAASPRALRLGVFALLRRKVDAPSQPFQQDVFAVACTH